MLSGGVQDATRPRRGLSPPELTTIRYESPLCPKSADAGRNYEGGL